MKPLGITVPHTHSTFEVFYTNGDRFTELYCGEYPDFSILGSWKGSFKVKTLSATLFKSYAATVDATTRTVDGEDVVYIRGDFLMELIRKEPTLHQFGIWVKSYPDIYIMEYDID